MEHVGDGVAAEPNGQGFLVVAGAVAYVAGDVDVGQEVHLNLDLAVALARLAAAAHHVKGEATGPVATNAGLGQEGEELPDRGEEADIGGRIGTRGASDGRLVDDDRLVDVLEAAS